MDKFVRVVDTQRYCYFPKKEVARYNLVNFSWLTEVVISSIAEI